MENQRSVRLAREADTDKTRTIGSVSLRLWFAFIFQVLIVMASWLTGVLTKPDTLTAGAISARQKWKEIIQGNYQSDSHSLRLGYYCVKLPDDAERAAHPSRSERFEREIQFFSNNEPWSAIPNRGRFGVRMLVTDLSKHLTNLLNEV